MNFFIKKNTHFSIKKVNKTHILGRKENKFLFESKHILKVFKKV